MTLNVPLPAPASLPPSVPGWFGKMPAAGDFFAKRIPAPFGEAWDRWLQEVLQCSRARLGETWLDAYLSMAPWRFVLVPGALTKEGWAGVLVPSVDRVGRWFPLTLAAPLAASSVDAVATLLRASEWFERMEALALSAVTPRPDRDAIDAALLREPFRSEWLVARPGPSGDADLTIPFARQGPRLLAYALGEHAGASLVAPVDIPAAWAAEESEVLGRWLLATEGLPPPQACCAMMDGRWAEHGWEVRGDGTAS